MLYYTLQYIVLYYTPYCSIVYLAKLRALKSVRPVVEIELREAAMRDKLTLLHAMSKNGTDPIQPFSGSCLTKVKLKDKFRRALGSLFVDTCIFTRS